MKDFDFKDLIERVRERVDIVQVIGQRIALDHHHKALCPFHEEKTPSFSVNPKGQYFHCFGCGVGGDVFRFLELYENKPFMEVLSELASQVGIPEGGTVITAEQIAHALYSRQAVDKVEVGA
jgi:DNA primase